MNDDVTVRLRYATEGEPPWEEEAAAWFADHVADRPDPYDQEVSLFVTAAGREAQVHDQALYLIPTLCFDAVVTVLAQGTVEFVLANAATGVRVTVIGDQVELASTVFDPVSFDKWATLEGLVECGERCIALLRTVWAGTDEEAELVGLAARAEAARRALSSANPRPTDPGH